jgi:hypothetical protein
VQADGASGNLLLRRDRTANCMSVCKLERQIRSRVVEEKDSPGSTLRGKTAMVDMVDGQPPLQVIILVSRVLGRDFIVAIAIAALMVSSEARRHYETRVVAAAQT